MTVNEEPDNRAESLAGAWGISAEIAAFTAFWFVLLRNIVCDGLVRGLTGKWDGLSLTGNPQLWDRLIIAQCSILLGLATFRLVQSHRFLALLSGSVLWSVWLWFSQSSQATPVHRVLDVLLALSCISIGALAARRAESSGIATVAKRLVLPLAIALILLLGTCAALAFRLRLLGH